MAKPKQINKAKLVKEIARERLGMPRPMRRIEDKRRQEKYPPKLDKEC